MEDLEIISIELAELTKKTDRNKGNHKKNRGVTISFCYQQTKYQLFGFLSKKAVEKNEVIKNGATIYISNSTMGNIVEEFIYLNILILPKDGENDLWLGNVVVRRKKNGGNFYFAKNPK